MNERQCPLCGQPLTDDGVFCSQCDESAKQRSGLDLLSEVEEVDHVHEEELVEESLEEDVEKEEAAQPESIQPKSKTKLIIISLFIVILLSAVGVAWFMFDKEKRAQHQVELSFWFSSIEKNTPEAYSKYLYAYPSGQFSVEAQAKIAELRQKEADDWAQLQKSDSLQDYYLFIDKYPDTPFRNKIRHTMDSLSWIVAERKNTSESYLAYIENYKLGTISGYYASVAQKRYDYLKHVKTVEGEELDAVKATIQSYFLYLSELKYNKLSEVLPATLNNFYGEKNRTSDKILRALKNDISRNQIKALTYSPDFSDMKVLRDSAGIYLTELSVEKNVVYEKKKKKGPESIKEFLRIELSDDLKIRSVFQSPVETKK